MDELEKIQKEFENIWREEEKAMIEKNEDLIESFINFAKKKNIILNKTNFSYLHTIGIFAKYENLVELLDPTLARDKEGLVNFKDLYQKNMYSKKLPGFMGNEKFIIMANSNFRRNYYENNNFAPKFIEQFWRDGHKGYDAFISLDYNRVRINVDLYPYIEKDTWFGPKFKKDISEITDGPVKIRPTMKYDKKIVNYAYNNSYGLNVYWKTREGIKIFEAEDFKNETEYINRNGIELYPSRYVHAEYDLASKEFRHLDGAYHFYTKEEYMIRRDSTIDHNKKSEIKIKGLSEKMFKFNGKISVETFLEFTGQFYVNNPLILEYFEGDIPEFVKKKFDRNVDNSGMGN
ncbi:MAG: hypothetical protein PHW02_02175 [bacterium]|nr:hypothetical protein [bacterium]